MYSSPLFYMAVSFDDYFNKDKIINYLSRQRAKYAKKRNKEHIMANISEKSKRKLIFENKRNSFICRIMPPRRKWVRISKEKRYHDRLLINSVDRNSKAIFATIKKHIENSMNFEYLNKLENFINEIKGSINDNKFKFQPPKIRPEQKEKGKSECRPIASFYLKDNIINCLTNKYLVNFLDELFYDNSFAFRAKRYINGDYRAPNHHDAFNMIINYLKENGSRRIYIAECDMQKFYDTVNHFVVIKQFRKLCNIKFKLKGKIKCDKRAVKILLRYLECYNFFKNVYLLNKDQYHFEEHNIQNGKYEWIKEYKLRKYYKDENKLKQVGIPQGGALSGLIANIVLNYADEKIMMLNDKNLLYVRYCDDMIMMHTNSRKCKNALDVYMKSLRDLKLFPHQINNEEYSKKFWNGKSRGPYEWSNNNVPWVGFVGYEINRKGEIRVRKKSLKKEISKQNELIKNIISALYKNNLNISKSSLLESVYNRLNGMAVGRVALWNFPDYKNDMCWVKGFQLLNKNKYSLNQLKILDRTKNKNIFMLIKRLRKINDENIKIKSKKKNQNREKIYYGMPFSYYFQSLKNK